MITDQIADLLTRIRNAQRAGHPAVNMPASKKKESLLKLLVDEGYIAGIEQGEDANGKPQIKVYLRYDVHGQPVIREIQRISRPGKRIYVAKDEVPRNKSGLGLVVVSTSKGLLSDQQARKQGLGGELICSVF